MAEEQKPKRRRKKSPQQERRAKAEYMKRRRLEAKAVEETATPGPVTKPNTAGVDAESRGPGETEQQKQDDKKQWLTQEQAKELLQGAIAGTCQALADTVQMLWLDADRPHLGDERAQTIGKLWAPILAPFITEESAKWLAIALAGGGTANVIYQWSHEYGASKPKLKIATPLKSVEQAQA